MEHSPKSATPGSQNSTQQVEKDCIFSDHNAMKLEINHKKKFGRIPST